MEGKERYEWRYSPKTMEDHMFDNLTKIKIYYENIPNLLNQYEKQIKEVEKGKQELKTYLDKAIDDCNKFFEENQQLKQQLVITEKALELAGETIKQMCGKPLWIGGSIPSPEPKDSKYFKDITKEMLENE